MKLYIDSDDGEISVERKHDSDWEMEVSEVITLTAKELVGKAYIYELFKPVTEREV